MAIKLESGERILLKQLHNWALSQGTESPQWLNPNTYPQLLDRIGVWSIIVKPTSAEGFAKHVREVLYSILLHLEAARNSHANIESLSPDSNDNWVAVNMEYNSAIIAVCASLDLAGHLYSLSQPAQVNNLTWDTQRWEFINGSSSWCNKANKLPDNSIPANKIGRLPWGLSDVIKSFRDKPMHGTYCYLVIRKGIWAAVKPDLSLREIAELRSEAKPNWDLVSQDKIDGEAYICDEAGKPLEAKEIVCDLIVYSLKQIQLTVSILEKLRK